MGNDFSMSKIFSEKNLKQESVTNNISQSAVPKYISDSYELETVETKVLTINNLLYHEYYVFDEAVEVIVERNNPDYFSSKFREQIVKTIILPGNSIKVFDAFGDSAFENPVKVNEILFYGKSSEDGYYITFPKGTRYRKIKEYYNGKNHN